MANRKDVNNRKDLIAAISDLKEKETLILVKSRLSNGDDPFDITKDCQEGLKEVGLRYEKHEYYLAGLIMAGEIFQQVMELLQPSIKNKFSSKEMGTILIGTARGDIHYIGKTIAAMLLTSNGFTVHDLGVDVPPAEFLAHTKEIKPDILGISGLVTSSYDSMKETVDLIRLSDDAMISSMPIIIGGNQLNDQVCEYIGADYWVDDAMLGVRLCKELVGGS
jgi:5-methyltetrahydrofolate--homocysteine methyltransferase